MTLFSHMIEYSFFLPTNFKKPLCITLLLWWHLLVTAGLAWESKFFYRLSFFKQISKCDFSLAAKQLNNFDNIYSILHIHSILHWSLLLNKPNISLSYESNIMHIHVQSDYAGQQHMSFVTCAAIKPSYGTQIFELPFNHHPYSVHSAQTRLENLLYNKLFRNPCCWNVTKVWCPPSLIFNSYQRIFCLRAF